MRPRTLIVVWIAAAIGIATTISLGNWQTRRGDTKLALQAQADRAERSAPIDITSRSSIEEVQAQLPRKVKLSGVFDAAGTVYLDNRMLNGVPGLYVITPFVVAEGLPAVLIDRGWMARDMQDRKRVVAEPPVTGRVTVEGMAVARPSMLFELGDGGKREVPGIWHNLDYMAYEEIYKQMSGRSIARFVVRQHGGNAKGVLRAEWPRPASGVEKHQGYAFQWYSLAAAIAAFTAWFSWKSWRHR